MQSIRTVQPIRQHSKIEEMKQTLRRQSYRDCFLFLFGINTGLRISDILPLKVKDVKGTHITLREQKTRKKREIKINPAARILIDEYIKGLSEEDYLFPSKKSGGTKPIGRVQAYRILNEAAVKCGLEEIGTHTLRKTFGYHHYKQKKDVVILQRIFNHSSPSVTLRYIGMEQDEIDNSMEDFQLGLG